MVYSNPCPTHTEIYSRLSCCKMLLCIPITQFIQNEKKLLSKIIYQSMTKSIIPSKKHQTPSKTIKNNYTSQWNLIPLYHYTINYTVIPVILCSKEMYVTSHFCAMFNPMPCKKHQPQVITGVNASGTIPTVSQWPF